MACSYYDSIPSLYITGAPVTKALKKNQNLRQLGFQEMEIKEMVSSFTKYAVRITDVKKISYEKLEIQEENLVKLFFKKKRIKN